MTGIVLVGGPEHNKVIEDHQSPKPYVKKNVTYVAVHPICFDFYGNVVYEVKQ